MIRSSPCPVSKTLTLVVALVFLPPALSPAASRIGRPLGTAEQRKAFDDLAAHYRDQSSIPVAETLEALASADSLARRAAGAYLKALFQQSLEDESNGRSPWTPVPYWGGGAENAARTFRHELATSFGRQAVGEEALPALEWLILHEPVPDIRAAGAAALSRVGVPRSPPLLRRVLDPANSNAASLLAALDAAARLRSPSLSRPILALCYSPRTAVRVRARAVADSLGLDAGPESEPAALITPALDRDLRAIAAMTPIPVPPRARFAQVHVLGDSAQPGQSVMAWVIGESDPYRLLDVYGRERSVARSAVRIENHSLAEEARRLIRIRNGPAEARAELSANGDLTGQFEPRELAVPEALVAAWCLEHGDRTSAALLILPRLDALTDDRELRTVTRDLLGVRCLHALLEAFSYHRDYPRAAAYARRLAGPAFDGFRYQPLARELAHQLARRHPDFRTLTLPDSNRWRELRTHMSRPAQVEYLTARLRLLNAFQGGQPGGVMWFMPQHERPWHLAYTWDERPNDSRRLINPLEELYGMRLDVAEIPLLLPHLGDRDIPPTFGFWRDFHPDRELWRVGQLVEGLINGIARRPLVHADDFLRQTPKERRAYLERAAQWSRSHAGMDEAGSDLDVMETTTSASEFISAVEHRAKAGDRRAVPIILRRIDEFGDTKSLLVPIVFRLDAPEAAAAAREWIHEALAPDVSELDVMSVHRRDQIRFHAALILLRHGHDSRGAALDVLDEILENKPDYATAAKPVVDSLLPDTLRVLRCGAFDRQGRDFGRPGAARLLSRLLQMGCRNALDSVLEGLASESPAGFTAGVPVGNVYPAVPIVVGDLAASVVEQFRSYYVFDQAAPETERRKRRAELAEWLAGEFRKIEAGEIVRWRRIL